MSIIAEVLKKIKEEITNDPLNIGYAGKTDDEIVSLLNNPVVKQKIVEETLPSPINRILSGIEYPSNVITIDEVKEAKK